VSWCACKALPPQAPEYGIIETYLEWLVALPWHTPSMDHLGMAQAHVGLDEVLTTALRPAEE